MTIYVGGYTPVQIIVGDLTTTVRNNIGDEETTSDIFRDRDIARWCNEIIADFARRTKAFKKPDSFTVLAGVSSIALPEGFRGFDEVRVNNKIVRRIKSMHRVIPVPVATPRFYTIIDGNIVFESAPSSNYVVSWDHFYLPLLSSSLFGTLTDLPVQYASIITNGASARGASLMPKPDQNAVARFERLYEDAVMAIIGEVEDEQETADVEIRNVFDPYYECFEQSPGDGNQPTIYNPYGGF